MPTSSRTYYSRALQLLFLFLLAGKIRVFSQDSTHNPVVDKVLSMVETVVGNDNFIDNLAPDSNIALPFGIRRQIGAARYVVAIDSCKFEPNGAYFNAYAAIDFPGTTKKLAFEAMHIKFNPKGVVGGNQSRLMLVSEHSIRINNLVTLKLKNDGNNWIEWDCNGYKAINLKGYFVFNKDKLIPDTTQTKDTAVTASFQVYTTDLHEFVTQVNVTPFMIKDLKNWSFMVKNATVDMSELINYPGMMFPTGYSNPNMLTPQMWSGFYLQTVKVRLPSEISKEGKRTELLANNLLIDNMGVTGLFQINNLFTLDEGSMSGWDYSIDELGVGFLCNTLNSGHLKGKVNIPVMDSAQALAYSASVYYNPGSKEADYSFTLFPANNIKFNVFSAQVNLDNTSQISVVKYKGLFKPTALLNGYIGFNHSNFNSNGGQLQFQSLKFVTHSPYIMQGIFTLHNIGGKTKAANYPASVNDITFGVNLGAPILTFSVSINLMDKVSTGFSAGTTVSLIGKINSTPVNYTDEIPVSYTKTKWKFDKLKINSIAMGVKTTVFSLNGVIAFHENDPVYGDGFFGSLMFSIDKVLPAPAAVTSRFGSKSDFRYFYVDAAIPAKIPLGGSPITITKIMGGLYYHMQPLKASQTELINASKTQPANVTTALNYMPDSTWGLGFKAGVGFAYAPEDRTANGNVMLEVGFTKGNGLSFVNLGGDIYFLAKPEEQVKSPIIGSVNILFDAQNNIFDANASVTIKAYNGAINGIGNAKVHIEPGTWYACIGKPSSQNTVKIYNLANVKAYFMSGNSIEPALTPPPQIVSELGSGALGPRDVNALSSGSGFCAGASFSAKSYNSIDLGIFQAYGNVDFTTGFDMMMFDYGSNGYCAGNTSEKIGLNGKLASGNMYVYFYANVGVKGKVAGQKFDKTIFSSSVAGMISGRLPKPLYMSGKFKCDYNILDILKGDFDFDYTYGTDCTPVKN